MIPLLLAQVPSATALASWLQVLMYLGGFVCTIIGGAVGIKMLRTPAAPGTPQPLVVQAHAKYATDEDLRQTHGRISREREEIDKAVEALRAEYRALSDKLDDELKDIRQTVDDVPDRTIKLLRETKGLL
jgi:hypothetical protein